MASNLDSIFQTDKKSEEEGIWLDITDDIGFKVKRFGGFNSEPVKRAMTKYYKPFSALIEKDILPVEKTEEIMVRVFVESSLLDWKGVQIDGVEVPFNKELAVKELIRLKELFNTLVKHSSDFSNYKSDLGNS